MTAQAAAKTVVFYEKPGCGGNRRQKTLLQEHGVELEVRDLLSTPWTRERLEAFFAGLEKDAMVNTAAPKIKSGEVDVAALSRDELIGKMLAEPLLIKRPLLEVGETRICGFDIPRLNALLGVDMPVPETINSCLKTDKCSSH
ncbi:ArsC/Spx/MgsR family protein [Azotobacter beijerinckii]|uniref:ArsC/Spx/MgsR family protein n=1 Tax=Azotobacter beijerinckii TaxID=170623 RepID=UPI002955C647|nr:ArsC/Spx/MgsR family protein [Azotobacter beijerinckii]MDV7210026.1 ArsC/Spx/MgsR family protein [Azotobacter beijerinckii]